MAIKTFAAIDVGSFELELGIYEISGKYGIREIGSPAPCPGFGKRYLQ